MKKKILRLLILVILVTVFAVTLSACGFIFSPSDEDNDDNIDKSTIPRLVDFVADSPRYDSEQKCFVFYYGEKVEISSDEFVVTVYYKDDSSKITDDIIIENPFESPNYLYRLGTHSLSVRYEEGDFVRSKTFNVEIRPVPDHVVEVREIFETEYTGDWINILQFVNEQLAKDGEPTLTEREEAEEIICRPKYSSVKEAGMYEILILPTQNYLFDNFYVWVKVTPKTIDVPTLLETETVYDGKMHPPRFKFAEDTESLIKITCETYADYVEAKTYLHVATIKDSNYIFGTDENGEAITKVLFEYKILPKVLDYNKEDLKLLRTEYPYRSSGYFIADIEHDFDTEVFEVRLSKSWVEIGTHSVCLHCPLPDCYRYKNGDTPEEDLSFEFTVYKLTFDYSGRLDEIAETLIFRETYRENLLLSDVIGSYLDDDDFLKKVLNAVDCDDTSFYRQTLILDDDITLEAGRNVCNIRYTPYETGYNYTLLPITVEVEKCEISLEYTWPDYWSDVTYDGAAHSYQLEIAGLHKDKLTETEYVTKIRTDEDNYQPVEEAINAGSYVTIATVALQPQYEKNYKFVEPAENKTTLFWNIRPAPISLKREQYRWSDITKDMFEPIDEYDASTIFTVVGDIEPLVMTDFAVFYALDSKSMWYGRKTNVIKTPGYYMAKATFVSTDPNYDAGSYGTIITSWEIFDTVIDLSGVQWQDVTKTVTYGEEIVLPELIGVPDMVSVRYSGCSGGLIDAGSYYYKAEFTLDSSLEKYDNSDRVTIIHQPAGVWFRVEPVRITADNFKVVYDRHALILNDTYDYDANNPPKYYSGDVEFLFYVECDGLPLKFNYSYTLLSSNILGANIEVTDAGIECSASGRIEFKVTITSSEEANNYYIAGNKLEITKTVYILKG